MTLKKIYEDPSLDLFPFYMWAEAWEIRSKPIVGQNVPVTLLLVEKSHTKFYADMKNFKLSLSGLHEKFLNGLFEKTVENSEKAYVELTGFCEKLSKSKLTAFSNVELSREFRYFHNIFYEINSWGMVYSLLEYPESLVTQGLEKYLEGQAKKAKVQSTVAHAYSTLTAPTQGTMLRKLREKILELAIEVELHPDATEFFTQTSDEITAQLPEKLPCVSAALDKITREYFWINWGYTGPAMTKSYFVSEVKQEIGKHPSKKLAELRAKDAHTLKERQKLLKEFQVDELHARRFKLCSELVHFKNYRKEMIYYGLCHAEKLEKEIAKRLGLSSLQVRYFLPDEIYGALESGRQLDADTANARYEFCAHLIENGRISLLDREEAQKWMAMLEKEESIERTNEIKGNCACAGNAKGIARIVRSSHDIGKMQQGDILVSFSTSPNMVSGMRKAAAVVTEQGGVASHAAIVTREFNIPCVVGAKNATKIFNDGDLLEVDATKGIVRKIEK